jgi:hypothetical protein
MEDRMLDKDALRLNLDEEGRTGARIKVVGVGGGASNAVNRMVTAGLDGVELIVVNTDLQALKLNAAPHEIALLLWARFVLLVACGALVALYLWIGYRSHRAG